MKAAIVHHTGGMPVYGDIDEPSPAPGESLVDVSAAAVSHVVLSRASGAHYSASHRFPFVVGVDGVGRLDDGTRVYFLLPTAPYGSMAERTVVASSRCIVMPDGLDDVTAAAIANPGMSSWAAFTERARLQAGQSVLVNGATGSAGRLAVQIAKWLGAARVIATGRNTESLHEVAALGADVTIALGSDGATFERALKEPFAAGVDVVLDYLWGESAGRVLAAAARAGSPTAPIRFVQVGSASAPELVLPSAVLRSSSIELLGSGIGSVPPERFVRAVGELLHAAVPASLAIATASVPLSEVERAWSTGIGARRTVFTVDG